MIRVAIVEDEEKEYKTLHGYINRFGKEHNVNFCVDYFPNAVDFVSDYKYDYNLIFMDIMMPGINGMNAAKRLREKDKDVELIFVTNMEQYAIQGYNVSARYFMLKPIAYGDFAVKMENTLTHIAKESRSEFIMLHLPFGEMRKVTVKDIRYIDVFSHNLNIHLYDEVICMRGRLADFEETLPPKQFCRVNSCYIVNLDCVKAVKDRVVDLGDVELNVSHARKKVLMHALAEYVAQDE